MEKKLYISPISEVMNLHAMNAMMDDPLFGPASNPSQPFGAPARWKDPVKRTPVF